MIRWWWMLPALWFGYLSCWLMLRSRVQRVMATMRDLERIRAMRYADFLEQAQREIRELENFDE